MPYGWEGSHMSGVTLAMRHGLQWFTHPLAQGLSEGDEHPPTLLMGYGTRYLNVEILWLYLLSVQVV